MIPKPRGPYSPFVRAGDFIFVSGQGPIDPATNQYSFGSIQHETRLVLNNIKTILEGCGASMQDVVKCSVFIVDGKDFAAMNEVYAEFFGNAKPARTTVEAKFVAQSKQVSVPNIIGSHFEMSSPGYVVFKLDGRELRLEPVIEDPGDKELFFIFRDQTAGKETYGAGRFLYADLPRDGKVTLDFNKAENPPCAFTPYATCPLPTKQNMLPVRIEAGELKAGSGH